MFCRSCFSVYLVDCRFLNRMRASFVCFHLMPSSVCATISVLWYQISKIKRVLWLVTIDANAIVCLVPL